MKSITIALAAFGLVPISAHASTFSEALDRMDIENPEFVVFADVTNDFSSIGTVLTDAYLSYLMTSPDVPPVPVNFTSLFQQFGLANLTSVSMASEPVEAGIFRNEFLAEFEGSPSGLFLLFGSENKAFSIPDTVPSDASVAGEIFFNGNVLFEMIRGIVIDMMGPMGADLIDGQMSQPIGADGTTIADVILRLNTRVQFALKPAAGDADLPVALPQAFADGQGAILVDDISDLLDSFMPMLLQAGLAPVEGAENPSWVYNVPSEAYPFSIYLTQLTESNDLLVTLGETSMEWFTNPVDTLANSEEFQAFTESLPQEGLSLWYATEAFGKLQVEGMDASLQGAPQYQALVANLKDFLMRYIGTQASVSYLEEDAYRTTSLQPASLKSNIGVSMVGMAVGVLAASIESIQEANATGAEDEVDPAASPAD